MTPIAKRTQTYTRFVKKTHDLATLRFDGRGEEEAGADNTHCTCVTSNYVPTLRFVWRERGREERGSRHHVVYTLADF